MTMEELKNKVIERGTRDISAVKQNGLALEYVKEQTPEICLDAVNNNIDAMKCIKSSVFE